MTGLQGRTFGGYQLLAPLGAGGVAEAYRAKPLQGSGREVVVKIIQPNLAQQPAFQTRFQLAMQKAAALANHTHVLPVLGSGEEGGFAYIVTPYVPEGTLRDWIGRGWRLGLTDVGPFFRQLATGLAYAHSLGIAHENLKPVNIYLFEGRHVLLGDFGVLWDVAQINPQLSGPAAEAVAYLAPEAFNKVFTPAADIYSLGAVLFTTLTGRAPFHGQTPGEVYSAHMNQPVPPLGATAPSLARQLQSLDLVIQRAMAKRPDERYPTPLLFADAVESTLAQAQKGRLGKSRRPSVWSLGNDNPLTFNEFGMPVLAGQAGPASQIGGASAGGLQPLNFRRPTKVGGLDGLMEDGYIGGNWNDGGAPGALQVPAPLGQPVSPMVAPPMAPPWRLLPWLPCPRQRHGLTIHRIIRQAMAQGTRRVMDKATNRPSPPLRSPCRRQPLSSSRPCTDQARSQRRAIMAFPIFLVCPTWRRVRLPSPMRRQRAIRTSRPPSLAYRD